MGKHEQVYEKLTAQVIELMEEGGDWLKPWVTSGRPKNAVSGHHFTGGNFMVLQLVRSAHDYSSNLWATYKQWESIGAQVRKGEKGIGLVRVGTSVRCTVCKWKGGRGQYSCPAHPSNTKRSMFPVGFTVFHASQVDGFVEPEVETFEHDPIEEAERFFAAVGADVRHGGDRAYFSPSADYIQIPERGQFRSAEGLYATIAHEHTHWTGHDDRLNRGLDRITKFGDPVYAREELVAELGSVFLCADLGVEHEVHEQHSAYLASWLKALKDDPSFIWKAASDAEKAVRFLHERVENKAEVAA